MNQPAELSPVTIFALARLLTGSEKGESVEKLGKDLAPLVRHRWEGRDWTERLTGTLNELETTGAVSRIKARKTSKLTLTAEGRALVFKALGFSETPAKLTWAKLKATFLPALALGRPSSGGVDLKAEILRTQFGLGLGDRPKLKDATAAVAAKLMSLEPGQKFDADTILRKLLHDKGILIPAREKPNPTNIGNALFRKELGDPSAKKPLDLIVIRSVQAQNNKKAELSDAVLRSWVDRTEPHAEPQNPLPSTSHVQPAAIELADFARRVVEAARESPGGWFGDAKVFISHVWRVVSDEPAFQRMDVDTFKSHLVEAHRARLLELGRADLVEAMDPVDVRESATPYQNAVYHFVRTEETAR